LRKIGLHLQVESTLVNLISKALKLKVDFFQYFLTLRTAGRVIPLDSNDIKEFVTLRRNYFNDLYLHISYWVNLSAIEYNPHHLLKKELELAKRLELTHVIFHPGSAKGVLSRSEGIDALARMLNKLIKEHKDLKFVVENVAQDFPSIGGDLNDFKMLLQKLDEPENLFFCIDTAHAHSFGYNIVDNDEQDSFVNLIEETIGFDKLVLIHLNDSAEDMGSRVDKHDCFENGKIGEAALKRFIFHSKLIHTPILMEFPLMSYEHIERDFLKVVKWHK